MGVGDLYTKHYHMQSLKITALFLIPLSLFLFSNASINAQEIAPDDFRISFNGPNGDLEFDATAPAIAYNSTDSQYLAVWAADDIVGGMVNAEFEIFGQLINIDGSHDSTAFRISTMGGSGNAAFDGTQADVAYNFIENNFLVIWRGDSVVNSEFEVWAQLVDHTGQLDGTNFQISNEDISGDGSSFPTDPRISYNSTNNEFLIVWSGINTSQETEIFGKILDGSGTATSSDFQISEQGPLADTSFEARTPSVVYNSQDNAYLVAWEGDDNIGSLANNEFEIYGQRLDDGGNKEGSAFRISNMGIDGQNQFVAVEADLTYNSTDNQYLVVWRGDDATDGDFQIYVQLLDATGSEIQDVSRISDMAGNTGNALAQSAEAPSVCHDPMNNRYLVIWDGDDEVSNGDQLEIFGQFLSASAQEIGPDDFRISTVDDDASSARFREVRTNDLVFNNSNGEFLAVWAGEDTGTNEEFEIFGQLLDLQSPLKQFLISDMGPTGNIDFDAFHPSVAYNAIDNEYLVVWEGDDNTGNLVAGEFEIFGQLLTADGFEIGTDFRISEMGPDGNNDFAARNPSVAYNSIDNTYLVVWEGDDNTGGLALGEIEIFGQLLTADGSEISADFRISDMGPDGNNDFAAGDPSVAYNASNNNYLVVWHGDDNTGNLVEDEIEIFGQLISATGMETGTNDIRISDMGPDGNDNFDAVDPSVAYNTSNNNYLVVWEGNDDTGNLVVNEIEIFGQLISATGVETGTNDIRISDMGPDGNGSFDAVDPSVAYNTSNNNYLVVWEGDDDTGNLVNAEDEIFGQLMSSSGNELGPNDFRISDMGPHGNNDFDAKDPSVAYNSSNNNYLVAWEGDDNTGSLVDNEFEIFGQLVSAAGNNIGTNDFRISDMGPDGNENFDAFDPVLIFNPAINGFLVVWEGDDNILNLIDEEFEIFGELIDASAIHPCALVLDDAQIGSPIATGLYQASEIINSSGLISSGNDVRFNAGTELNLLPDFEVELGALFEVLLDGCD